MYYGLLTDLYQLTMGYGYWKTGKAEQKAVFNLFFRKLPFKNGYAVAAFLLLHNPVPIPSNDWLNLRQAYKV